MPSSKKSDDPEYDPRFDMMLEDLRQLCPKLKMVEPIKKRTSTQPLHEGGNRNVADA